MKNLKCLKDFLRYSSLNVLGMIGLSCYILADTFFVSKALGAGGLAALNLAIPVYSFINGSGLMVGMGGGIKYAIKKGQKARESCDRTFTSAVVIMVCLSVVLFLMGLFASDFIAKLLKADVKIFEMTKTYIRIILLFSPVFMLNNLLLCFVRNDGAPQLSMGAMLGGSFSNIVLDYIFMFPLKMGIFGAVLATGFAPLISMLILSPFFIKRKNNFHLCRIKISRDTIFDILSGGLPSLVTEVSSGIVMIVFNIIILGLEGNTGVAAYGIIANLSLVVMSVYTGIAQGMQPLVSGNYGAGRKDNVHKILSYSLAAVTIVSVMVYLFITIAAEGITAVFNSEKNSLLQSIAVRGLKYYFTACIFAGFNIIISAYFASVEHVRSANMVSVLRGFVIIIPTAFILAAAAGIIGVWFAFPVTELLVSMVGIAFYAVESHGR